MRANPHPAGSFLRNTVGNLGQPRVPSVTPESQRAKPHQAAAIGTEPDVAFAVLRQARHGVVRQSLPRSSLPRHAGGTVNHQPAPPAAHPEIAPHVFQHLHGVAPDAFRPWPDLRPRAALPQLYVPLEGHPQPAKARPQQTHDLVGLRLPCGQHRHELIALPPAQRQIPRVPHRPLPLRGQVADLLRQIRRGADGLKPRPHPPDDVASRGHPQHALRVLRKRPDDSVRHPLRHAKAVPAVDFAAQNAAGGPHPQPPRPVHEQLARHNPGQWRASRGTQIGELRAVEPPHRLEAAIPEVPVGRRRHRSQRILVQARLLIEHLDAVNLSQA